MDRARREPHPVSFSGVVTFPVPGVNWVFVQDKTAGVLAIYTNAQVRLTSGEAVTVRGHVGAGLQAPIIMGADLQVLGPGALPQALLISAARLAAGEAFGQWVEVEGAVRDVARDPSRLFVFVSSGGIRFHAVIQAAQTADLPSDWLGAQVQLRGVCWTDVDRENKPAGFTLYLPATNTMSLTLPGSSNIFSIPPLSEAGRLDLRHQSDRRIKVSGTVLFHSPAGDVFFEDRIGPIQARLLVPLAKASPNGTYLERPAIKELPPGTQIELVGAPKNSAFAPVLQDAEFRIIGQAPPPSKQSISAREALSGRYDRALVSLKGRLLARNRREISGAVEEVLLLQSGNATFEAIWLPHGTNQLPELPQDSKLAVTGLCLTQRGELDKVPSFRLLLRDPAELQVLGQALPWASWPVDRILWIGTLLGLAALGWIWLLRRKVAQSTADLVRANAQLQTEINERRRAQADLGRALLTERQLGELKSRFVSMVSHEFRTPLGIIMSSAEILQSYQERLPADKRREHLNDIFQSSRRMGDLMEEVLLLSRVEAGRLACKPEPLDLPALCRKLIEESDAANQQRSRITFKENGSLAGAQADESLLRHIFGNLLSNAVKYSKAGSQVEFAVTKEGKNAAFVVRDRGIGIPEDDLKQLFQAFHRARNVGETPGTGLGLVIAKRCVELHGGTIQFESTENIGTLVTVRLPLFQGHPSTAQ